MVSTLCFPCPAKPPAIIALLPLFRDNAHSIAMIKHSINVLGVATKHLNDGQVPVLTVNQPLYAIAKKYSGHGQKNMARTNML